MGTGVDDTALAVQRIVIRGYVLETGLVYYGGLGHVGVVTYAVLHWFTPSLPGHSQQEELGECQAGCPEEAAKYGPGQWVQGEAQ